MIFAMKHLLALGLLVPRVFTVVAHSVGNCTNTRATRDCWIPGYNISTDYNSVAPPGKLVQYDLVVSEQEIAPDGYKTKGMVVNGQYPGPLIEANWGDTIRVTVHNNLTNHNGTAIHWHGINQNQTNWYDGTPGVTQCPIAPQGSQTYEFKAHQYGTSWYHSHFSMQYSAGVYGPLVIHGPSSANWDVDLGPWLISDWYHEDVFGLDDQTLTADTVPIPESSILNGKGVYACNKSSSCTGNASYYEVIFQHGTTYKIALVNTATTLTYTFYIDGHDFEVIEADFVPIQPFTTNAINLGAGQRYEIVVKANAALTKGTNFWIHAQYCGLPSILDSRIGVIRYNASNTSEPATNGSSVFIGCDDPAPSSLTPVVEQTIGRNVNPFSQSDYMYLGEADLNVTWPGVTNSGKYWLWEMGKQPLYVNWSDPSLGRIGGLSHNRTLPNSMAPIYLDYDDGEWVYFVITNNYTAGQGGSNPNLTQPAAPHPIHLHGHDFAILAQGNGSFDASSIVPLLNNPARRDTAVVPIGGWVWLAFQVGNPGVWIMHCHIAFHSSDGFAVEFVEQASKVPGLLKAAGVESQFTDQCEAWSQYYEKVSVPAKSIQEDSGI